MRRAAYLVVGPVVSGGSASIFARRRLGPRAQWRPLRGTLPGGLGFGGLSLAWPA